MAAQGETYRPAFPPKEKPHIAYGIPFPESCAHHVTKTFKASKVYIVVSNSISKTENFTRLEQALGDRIAGVRKGIKPHTPWDDVLEIVKEVEEKGVDLLVTLGAGSLTDGAKLISFAVANGVKSAEDLDGLTAESNPKDPKPCQIPIINIPTSLSGGEYSPFAGATDTRSNHKAMFSHPSMGAALIILDPALSVSTPEETWLASGVRSIDHCVEGLCSFDEKVSSDSDEHFEKGLRLLVPNLLITKKDWDAEEPRLKEMMGVIEAMKGLASGVQMGGSHGIGHQLGPLGVGHGQTSCVLLPAVLDYNLLHGNDQVKGKQKKVLDILWSEEKVAQFLHAKQAPKDSDLGDIVGAIIEELGLPRTLKDVGVDRDKFDKLAQGSLKDRWLKTNAVPLTEKSQVLEILTIAAGDGAHGSTP